MGIIITSGGIGKKKLSINETKPKKIFEFCELPWEAESLEFYKSKKTPIKTVSIVQARQPIYKTSIKASDNYSQFLGDFQNLK